MSEHTSNQKPPLPIDKLPDEWDRLGKYYSQLAEVAQGAGYDKGSFTGKSIGFSVCSAQLQASLAATPSLGNREQALRDLIAKWRKRAASPADSVGALRFETNLCAEELEAALATQGAQAGEFDARSWLINDFKLMGNPDEDEIAIAERAYAAGQAAQPLQREVGQVLTSFQMQDIVLRHSDAKYRAFVNWVAVADEVNALRAAAPLQPQLEELRKLSAKATPEEWLSDDLPCVYADDLLGTAIFHRPPLSPFEQSKINCAFAAKCVNAVRKWLAPTEETK